MRFEGIGSRLRGPGQTRTGISELSRQALCPFELRGLRMYMEAVNQTTSLVLRLNVIIEPDEDRFHAYCPAFKGLHVDGASQEEALTNAGEAAIAYLNSLAANKEAIPIGPECQLAQIPSREDR
jgi:predicted RNase H-like HicB family nuclease